ncbi:MAG: DsrE family protein [candidate division Zixibacteria bacterium]|nr:DsrE family protein [candidate division Zixibacteria bacterium]MDH3936463.1 DsrE family protein [candidate division Zixibacteria bacterium]MDH4033108.1 DsrE family protein [candidate division Zixibacteria bacterium]
MSDEKKKLVILIACGLDDEKMSVAWSVAKGGVKTGLDVTVFLTAGAVDVVRKGAADKVRLNPMDPPVGEMMETVTSAGTKILVCPPCADVRGYTQDDFIDGVVITGSGAIHQLILEGAATLSF